MYSYWFTCNWKNPNHAKRFASEQLLPCRLSHPQKTCLSRTHSKSMSLQKESSFSVLDQNYARSAHSTPNYDRTLPELGIERQREATASARRFSFTLILRGPSCGLASSEQCWLAFCVIVSSILACKMRCNERQLRKSHGRCMTDHLGMELASP